MEYTVLSKLEAYLTLQNIEHKKSIFVQGFIENASSDIRNIKKEEGIVELFNSISDSVETYKFDDLIEKEFGNLPETKKAIDSVFIELPKTIRREQFVKYLANTIKAIVESEIEMFKNYPVLKKVILNLVHYLNEKHDCNINYPFNKELIELKKYYPPYTVRENYQDEKKFNKLYKLFAEKGIINNISKTHFVKIFMGEESSEYVKFRIDTPNAIRILTSMKHIYYKFKPVNIQNSKRFYTSGNILLTATNFGSSKQRTNKEYFQTTSETIKEIENIFPNNVY